MKKRAVSIIFSVCLLVLFSSPIYAYDTGGLKFSHIKMFSFIFGGDEMEINETEAIWMVENFDMVNGKIGNIAIWNQYSPETDICSSGPLAYIRSNDANRIKQWGIEFEKDYEEIFLHYKYDTVVINGSTIKGWNPADDQGQCGGNPNDWINDLIANIDGTCMGQPSDPQRTSPIGEEARTINFGEGDTYFPDIEDPLWLEWVAYDAANWNFFSDPSIKTPDCIWLDSAIFLPFDVSNLTRTFRYEGTSFTTPSGGINWNHPLVSSRLQKGAELQVEVSNLLNKEVFVWPNVGASNPHSNPNLPYRQIIVDELPNIYIQCWLLACKTIGNPSYQNNYENDLVSILNLTLYENVTEYLQTTVKKDTDSEWTRMFSLANFYLINNDKTYYHYNIDSVFPAVWPERDQAHPKEITWFDAMGYDIGQPIPNNFDKPDYKGEFGTPEHFIISQGQDPVRTYETYYILAREFENALVLVKFRPTPTSPTTEATKTHINLQGFYQKLNSDGTLGSTINRIHLKNNDATILIKKQGPLCNDGTSYGECSTNKPYFCNNGTLIEECNTCGCPSGEMCENNECNPGGSGNTRDRFKVSAYSTYDSNASSILSSSLVIAVLIGFILAIRTSKKKH